MRVLGNLIILTLAAVAPAYRMVTQDQNLSVRQGNQITLPCVVEDAGTPISWMKGTVLMSLGRQIFSSDSRFSFKDEQSVSDFSLVLQNASLEDEDNYACNIAGTESSAKHSLTINIPPSVIPISESEHTVLENDPLTLTCYADGKPQPEIIWTKVNDILPEGEEEFIGDSLILNNLSREDSGVYKCLAKNVEGEDYSTMAVNVVYPPTITATGEETIYTGPRDSVQLKCEFSANPEILLSWKHNGSDIDYTDRTNLVATQDSDSDEGLDVRILRISNLQPNDLGMYTCKGANEFGDAEASFILTAKPKSISIISDPEGQYSNQYTLEWDFHSVSPPIDYTLVVSLVNASGTFEFGTNLVPAQDVIEGSDVHRGTYTIEDLQPNETYEAEVQGRNEFGISGWSVIQFTTSEAGRTPPPPTPEPETEIPTEPEVEPGNGNRATTAKSNDSDEVVDVETDRPPHPSTGATLTASVVTLMTALLLGSYQL